MILIDLDNDYINLVLTLNELSSPYPEYEIIFQSSFSQDSFTIPLKENLSTNLNRYDYFQIDTSEFLDMPNGEYTYKVIQTNYRNADGSKSNPTGTTIETGKAKVIAPAEEVQPIIYTQITELDTIIYYNPNE